MNGCGCSLCKSGFCFNKANNGVQQHRQVLTSIASSVTWCCGELHYKTSAVLGLWYLLVLYGETFTCFLWSWYSQALFIGRAVVSFLVVLPYVGEMFFFRVCEEPNTTFCYQYYMTANMGHHGSPLKCFQAVLGLEQWIWVDTHQGGNWNSRRGIWGSSK